MSMMGELTFFLGLFFLGLQIKQIEKWNFHITIQVL